MKTFQESPPDRHEGPQEARHGPDEPPGVSDGLSALVAYQERKLAAVADEWETETTGNESPGTAWHSNRVAVRCTCAWATWLGALSTWVDCPASEILAQAVYRYAEAAGFPAPPPPRLSRPKPATVTRQTRAEFRGYAHAEGS